ncbi:hypothetical protein ACFVVX_11420 [Kitasatospora sp. NPDC058170]|uniref:cyanobactin maturation protease PatG family protein n=1 Tax=Kitasatospora sp. NPDC058170 TaxID=3346364 RepID=UPI0036DAC9A8
MEEPREDQESLQVLPSDDPTATPAQVQTQARSQVPAPDPYPPPAPPARDRTPVAPAHDPAPAQALPGPPAAANHVYALGRIEPRFPSLGVEKEWAQLAGRSKAAGLTDREAVRSLLALRENRYLAREMCWVFTVEGLETYLLRPRDPADFKLLIKSLRPADRLTDADVDVVIGTLGPVAPPEMCNGLTLPICLFDQLYCFDADSLIRSIPPASGVDADQFEPVAKDLFLHVVQLADNAGATDEHRALNYLSVRYPAIYHVTARRLAENAPLSAVEVDASRLGAGRRLVDVILAYRDRTTDVVDKYYVRVDVTEKYPFLVSKLAPYVTR